MVHKVDGQQRDLAGDARSCNAYGAVGVLSWYTARSVPEGTRDLASIVDSYDVNTLQQDFSHAQS